jgi:RNA polymerase sigma-70 factor (ECF subfamily)
MSSEIELLAACRSGDGRAGAQLLGRYFPSLYYFFCNKVGPETEDLIQETFIAFLQHSDGLREAQNIRPYLLRTARNKLFNYLRDRNRSRLDFDSSVSSVGDSATSPSLKVARTQAHTDLLMALRDLPVDLQVVLELHYWDELTSEQISEVLEIPVGTVKSRIRRAKEALRESMASRGPRGETRDEATIDRWASDLAADLRREATSPP